MSGASDNVTQGALPLEPMVPDDLHRGSAAPPGRGRAAAHPRPGTP